MDTNGRQGAGGKEDCTRKLALDKIKKWGYSIIKSVNKFVFDNTPRIYRISEGIYIRWRDWEYIIYDREW